MGPSTSPPRHERARNSPLSKTHNTRSATLRSPTSPTRPPLPRRAVEIDPPPASLSTSRRLQQKGLYAERSRVHRATSWTPSPTRSIRRAVAPLSREGNAPGCSGDTARGESEWFVLNVALIHAASSRAAVRRVDWKELLAVAATHAPEVHPRLDSLRTTTRYEEFSAGTTSRNRSPRPPPGSVASRARDAPFFIPPPRFTVATLPAHGIMPPRR